MADHLSFSEAAKPDLWMMHARSQRLVADHLWQYFLDSRRKPAASEDEAMLRVGCFSGALLHWALALENGANAVLLSRSADALKHPSFGNHKLIPLFERCGLTLDEEGKELLSRLNSYMVWAGRYPVTRSEDHYLASVDQKRAQHPTDQRRVHAWLVELELLAAS